MSYKKCCFTGNRAYKLPWGDNESDIRCIELKKRLKTEIIELIGQGFDYFISGMAQGIDTYCAEIVLELKKLCSHIQLECAIPSAEQTKGWEQKDITRYNKIIAEADRVIVLFERYNRFCNQMRNKYMVNNAELVLAVWNGENKGGTWSTIQYATKRNTVLKIVKLE